MGVPGQNRTDCMLGPKNRQGGFTMIEMMIVTAIVGIASTFAIPSYLEWKDRHDLRGAVSEIASDLNLARVVAMNRNRQATVTIQLSGSGVVQVSGSTPGLTIFPAQTMNGNVTGLPGGTANLVFSSMGMSTASANQSIQIANSRGLVYSVTVMPSGKVTWCTKATCP